MADKVLTDLGHVEPEGCFKDFELELRLTTTSQGPPPRRTIVDVGHVLLANARLLYHRGDWRAGSGRLVFQVRLSLRPKILEPGVCVGLWSLGLRRFKSLYMRANSPNPAPYSTP